MNFKKTVLYLLLIIFTLIFLYNYILPFFLVQNYSGMGMGMHMGGRNYSNNAAINSAAIFIVIILALGAFLILNKNLASSNCEQLIINSKGDS